MAIGVDGEILPETLKEMVEICDVTETLALSLSLPSSRSFASRFSVRGSYGCSLHILTRLVKLGLVKLQQRRKDSWFIPTKLATNLSVSLADSSVRKECFVIPPRQGNVMMETDFRMYTV